MAVTGASGRLGAIAGREPQRAGVISEGFAEKGGWIAWRHHAQRGWRRIETGTSDAASRKFVNAFYEQAIPADSIARAIRCAIEQPADVDVNQIVVRPTVQEF